MELTIDCIGDTQFRVEKRTEDHPKIWSGGPEICIAHILRGKRSQFGPSIPLDQIPELIEYLAKAYREMKQTSVQPDNPVV